MIRIIVRTCGERTTQKCIESCERQGHVDVINARPFGESIRQTYLKALEYKLTDDWICVIDADVILYGGVLRKAIKELKEAEIYGKNIFCFDGKTEDKILMMSRRAGIHIYKISILEQALEFIDNEHIKPESNVRRQMAELGYITYRSSMVFGKHDHEQYYCDLWRKAICQTQKLAKMIRNKPSRWLQLSKSDNDYLVIYNANKWGVKNRDKINITIDKENNFDAAENIKKLGLFEKGEL